MLIAQSSIYIGNSLNISLMNDLFRELFSFVDDQILFWIISSSESDTLNTLIIICSEISII